MAASLSETLGNLRSFVETSISDIENKYKRAIRDKESSLEEKNARLSDSNKQLRDENNRLAANVQELSGKLERVRAKLSRKDEELRQKDQWWEAYKHMSQKRFRVMKKTGTFPQDVMESYVNKSIQELISTCMDTEETTTQTQTRIIRLSRNKHSKKTRYKDIPASHVGQTTTAGGLWEEKDSNSSRQSTLLSLADARDTGQDVQSAAGIVVPNTPAADFVIGPPSASSTPLQALARDTQCTDWAPVTRLPSSDSQFPLDLSHSQPLSPTIPSNAPTPNDKGGKSDASYSLLPPLQECSNLGGRREVSDEGGRNERIVRAHGEGMQDKQLNCGKRKRKDSWKAHSPEPGSRTAVFKVPEPVTLRDLPTQANQRTALVKCSGSEMETSAVDMFADHSLSAGSASADSERAARDDCGEENREGQCEAQTKDGPFDNRKTHQKAEKFKYVEVVRKKEEREKLNGYACRDCQKYFESLDLPEKELRERLKQCSRHRAKFSPPPSTPPGFWNLSFPDTQTYIDKGYLQTEPHPRKKARKKKPTQEENHTRNV